MYTNNLIKLSKEDIVNKYENKPILVEDEADKTWYIVSNINSSMPLHMLTEEESDLYKQDEESISGIEVHSINGEGYLMWIDFNEK